MSVAIVFAMIAITACNPNLNTDTRSAAINEKSEQITANTPQQSPSIQPSSIQPSSTQADDNSPKPIYHDDGTISLDMRFIDTNITATDPATYDYPFVADSLAVQNYANAFSLTNQQAQQAMTLSMASPEVLNKVLDQLHSDYLGHRFVDGTEPVFEIYTTDRVLPTTFNYVIEGNFGKGLSLSVQIRPKPTP